MFEVFSGFDHAVMQAVQSISEWGAPVLDKIFLVLTFLGEETCVIILLIAVYWCCDKRTGESMLFSFYTAMSANGILKDVLCRPRPFLNPEFSDLRYVKVDTALVNTAGLGSSYSFPSGHAQTAGSIYGSLAHGHGAGGWIAAVAVTLLVMVSRIYLGVHYPTDTIAGAVLGLVLALICSALMHHFYEHKVLLMLIAVVLSGASLFLNPTLDTIKMLGLGVGVIAGMAMEDAWVDFRTDGRFAAKLLRLVLGFVLIMAIRLGLKAVFPDLFWFHALRYALMGFAATFLWPFIFTKLGL